MIKDLIDAAAKGHFHTLPLRELVDAFCGVIALHHGAYLRHGLLCGLSLSDQNARPTVPGVHGGAGDDQIALTCQIISNVPAAILLSRFTQDARGLLVGVNIGGAGTLVASLASLITFREYTRRVPGGTKRFLILFSAISFAFLTVLLAAMSFLG